ncbi:MAG: F0F1 ATP synthase subunit B family protein [Rhodospirillales bacterium]
MFSDPAFWVAVAFVVFIGLLAYLKVGGKAAAALDARADKIRTELDAAERLKTEAQDLLADYRKRQREAVREADNIAAAAKQEAQRMLEQGQARLEESLKRREKLAMDRIAQAEAAAQTEVRAHAVEIAVAAAQGVLAGTSGPAADRLIGDAVKALPGKLH